MDPDRTASLDSSRRAWVIALAMVLAYAMLEWLALRPDSILDDRSAWRQADTQQIALYGLLPDARFNVPRIAWAGPEPTAVEAEFQGYTFLISAIMRVTGEAEWPGQLVALLSMVLAGLALFAWLRTISGNTSGLIGLGFFLSCRTGIFLGSTIVPDGVGLMCFVMALAGFERWVHSGTSRYWWLWVAFTALAAVHRPLNLQLGIGQFLLLVFAARPMLRRPELWLGWGLILVTVSLQFLHGAQIHAQTGATFGVISGGDSKFVALRELMTPRYPFELLKVMMHWGVGPLGGLAVLYLLLRRRLDPMLWAYGLAHLVGLVLALRYTHMESWGAYYHAPGAVIAALALARAYAQLRLSIGGWKLTPGFALAIASMLGFSLQARLSLDRDHPRNTNFERIGELLTPRLDASDRLIVRSEARSMVQGWNGGPNNYQDPRLFYALRSTGWSLARDIMDPAELARLRGLGATLYIEPNMTGHGPEQAAWLRANADPILDEEFGRAWRLRPPAEPR